MNRKTSLPVSAQECAASASIDAEAVTTAANDLATAMRRLAPNATSTVRRLSDSPPDPTLVSVAGAPSAGTGAAARSAGFSDAICQC
jgi:hypothetical protein